MVAGAARGPCQSGVRLACPVTLKLCTPIGEADMPEISTRQRVLLRAIVLVIILIVLAMFGLIRRNAPIVY